MTAFFARDTRVYSIGGSRRCKGRGFDRRRAIFFRISLTHPRIVHIVRALPHRLFPQKRVSCAQASAEKNAEAGGEVGRGERAINLGREERRGVNHMSYRMHVRCSITGVCVVYLAPQARGKKATEEQRQRRRAGRDESRSPPRCVCCT